MEIKISLNNTFSEIETEAPKKVISDIDLACSFFDPGARFTVMFKRGLWDGKTRLFSSKNNRFPTGLISKVIEAIKENGHSVTLIDNRRKPEKQFDLEWIDTNALRPYQIEAVSALLASSRGRIDVGTGGGKNTIYCKLAHELGVKTLIFVNTKEALYDTYNTAVRCFGKGLIGLYGDGNKTLGEFITITTMATAYKMFDAKNKTFQDWNPDCTIADEVHKSGSMSWYNTMNSFDCYHKYGGSGTHTRADKGIIMLFALTGKIVYTKKYKALKDEGYLSPCKYYFVEVNEPKSLNVPFSDYKELYYSGITNNEFRNNLIVEAVRKFKDKQMLVLVESTEHGEVLQSMIKEFIPDILFVHGKSGSKLRKEIKEKFVNKEIKNLIASVIYNESVDIPCLECVIVCSGGKKQFQNCANNRASRKIIWG